METVPIQAQGEGNKQDHEFYKYLAHCLNDKIAKDTQNQLDYDNNFEAFVITFEDIMEAKKAFDSIPAQPCKKCEGLGEYYSDGWGECPRCRGTNKEPNKNGGE